MYKFLYLICTPEAKLRVYRKSLLIMKLTLVLLITTCLQLSFAAEAYTQKISLSKKNSPLVEIFKEIRRQSGYDFIYSTELINKGKDVNIRVSNVPLESVLDKCFSGQPFTYTIESRTIIVNPIVEVKISGPVAELRVDINGKVTDNRALPLIGVSIRIKGTTTGTSTDVNGNYSINAPEGSTLVFSYIGFVSQEIAVGTSQTINIRMQEEETKLSEVVITAFGISKEKKSLAYSVAEVKGDQFTQGREINLGTALTGRIAGVNASGTATGPGGSSRVVIRGNTSISGNNQPLYVINGIPMSGANLGQATGSYGGFERGDGLNSINPDDIETISVLKGGAAAALYGSRASNGVILITTKSGDQGQQGIGVEFNSSYVMQTLSVVPEWQYEYGSGTRGLKPTSKGEAVQYGRTSWGAALDGSSVINPDGVARPYIAQKDNFKNFYNTGQALNNSLAVSGGNKGLNFRFSVSDLNDKSIVPDFSYKRNTFDLNTSAVLSDKIIFKGNAQYNIEKGGNRPGLNDFTYNPNASLYVMTNSLDVRTLLPGFDDRGYETAWNDSPFAINPYFSTKMRDASDERKRFIGSLSTQYNITKHFYIKGQIGIDSDNFNALDLTPTGSLTNLPGAMSESQQTSSEVNLSGMLGYTNVFKRFSVDAFVGGNNMDQRANGSNFSSGNFNVPFNYFIRNGLSPNFSQSLSRNVINSLFFSTNIGFNSYLYLTVNGRQDWFSTLSPESNTLFYPSAGLSFVFTDFLKSVPSWLSTGKLRGSWAQVGGGAPNPYSLMLAYGAQSVSHLGRPMMNIGTNTIPNSQLKPYTSTTNEIGLELGMFQNRLRADISLYQQTTTDDIVGANVPNSTGYTNVLVNVGKMQNKGVELMLTANPLRSTSKINWETSYNLAYNQNEIVKISDAMDRLSVGAPPRTLNGFIYHFQGQPFGMIAGYKAKKDAAGNTVYDKNTGLPLQSDLITLGKGVAPLTMGINNSFNYKRFSFGFLVDGKFGGSIYSGTNANAVLYGLHKRTTEGDVRKNGVTLNGVDASGAPFTKTLSAQDYFGGIALRITDEFVYDADFVKLRQISFGYSLPATLLSKVGIKSARVSLVGRNLLLLYSKVPNLDPESNYHSSNHQGLDSFGVPPTRSFGLNMSLNF